MPCLQQLPAASPTTTSSLGPPPAGAARGPAVALMRPRPRLGEPPCRTGNFMTCWKWMVKNMDIVGPHVSEYVLNTEANWWLMVIWPESSRETCGSNHFLLFCSRTARALPSNSASVSWVSFCCSCNKRQAAVRNLTGFSDVAEVRGH